MVVTGRLAAVAAFGAVLVVIFPSWFSVLLVSGVLALALCLDAALAGEGTELRLSRAELTSVRLGLEVDIELVAVNTGGRTVRATLWDDWPASTGARSRSHRLKLMPGTKIRLHTQLTPTVRGDRVAGPVTVRTVGPLGLAGRQVRQIVPARVRALPPFRSERLVRSKVRRLQHLEGRNVADRRGQGSEFDSFREYVPGDDVRAIDWRATARARDVLVRTWRPERNRHVLLLLDTGRASAGRVGDGTRLDASIEAALLLGSLAAAGGDTADLLAFDTAARAEVRGVGGNRLPMTLLHAMSGLAPTLVDSDPAAMVRAAVQRTRRRSLVVWFTALDHAAAVADLLPVLPVLQQRHRVLIVSVTDPDLAAVARTPGTNPYAAAAAETVLADRALAQETLRHKGIDVITAAPANLPEALADEYLELKRSGTL